MKHKILRILIAAVWLLNGLVCKVLNLVPRHSEIVARILGNEYAESVTITIGLLEIGMAVWVFSGISTRLNAVVQILVIGAMNILEFVLVPDLLLWGRLNIIFASLFILTIYYNTFVNAKPTAR